MKSIIQELQIEATNPDTSVSDLLRKAKIVAVKLDLKDFAEWIENELNGYDVPSQDGLPSYRLVSGEPKAWNPYHGWQPIMFRNTEAAEMMTKRGVMQAVGELDDLAKTHSDGTFMIDYGPAAKKQIMAAISFQTDIKFMVGRGAVTGILEGVRNRILDWALKLEQAGVLGEGISFSREDKERAQEAGVSYHIGSIANFAGTLGNVDGSTVSVNQTNTLSAEKIKEVVEQIKNHQSELGLNKEQNIQVLELTKEIEVEVLKDTPEYPKLKSALSSLKNIFEGTTGNVVAQGILYGISKLLT